MKPALRRDLEQLGHEELSKFASHPGLWFDRYLPHQLERSEKPPKEGAPTAQHVERTAGFKAPLLYDASYRRWQVTLMELGAQTREMEVVYRLAAGHGGKNASESGLTLHHSYGVPIVPGSSLKGAAAAFADKRLSDLWGATSDAYKTLFGTTEEAGYITFLDALPLPNKWQLLSDVLTVHHRQYYQAGEKEPDIPQPADWDSPTPVSFLSVRGSFLIALLPAAGAEGWAKVAFEILQKALAEQGVGGKTSSGYGRLTMKARAEGA